MKAIKTCIAALLTAALTVTPVYAATSYLTGKTVDASVVSRRPVAVMFNNLQAAQPMTGISYADVVYEYPVEGSITRLMGVMENYDNLGKIGSVRSCREYFVYGALEFDAIYMHYGQAVYAKDILAKSYVDNINGVESIGTTAYYRTSDRKAPHNAYTSGAKITAAIDKMGYRKTHKKNYTGKFKFVPEGSEVTHSNAPAANRVDPKYKINKPWFEYNAADKLYYRYQYGGKHVDDATGQQLAYKNIILQYASWLKLDKKDYLGFDCHIGGAMQYITNGHVIEGTWRRLPGPTNNDDGVVKYYDSDGNEIAVNTGKTFICVIQNDLKNSVVIK